jgi:hypothetical protein
MNLLGLNADSRKLEGTTQACLQRDGAGGIPGSPGILLKSALPVLFAATWSQSAWAYIDPGTTGAVFSGLGYIIGMVAVAGGILFRPIRKLVVWMKRRFRRNDTD